MTPTYPVILTIDPSRVLHPASDLWILTLTATPNPNRNWTLPSYNSP